MSDLKDKAKELKLAGLLDVYAWHFACRVERLFPGGMDERLFLIAALVAQHSVCAKHICLDYSMVHALSDLLPVSEEEDLPFDAHAFWGVLSEAACAPAVGRSAADDKPLILEGSRIYLHRYHDYEVRLAAQLIERINTHDAGCHGAAPSELVVDAFELDMSQCAAVQSALKAQLSIITGGPGTGKTTILCVLLTELLRQHPRLRIHACAPTGKAQARMKEAVDNEFMQHIRPEVREGVLAALGSEATGALPVSYSTVHRLLGYNPGTGACMFTEANPLETDLVVVDEVSMADLAMTVKLFSAVPKRAKVVLLGDKDQLAAVEMGAVLGDIYQAWGKRPEVSCLTQSHRFRADTHIGELKELINAGDATGVITLLRSLEGHADGALAYEEMGSSRVSSDALMRVLQQNPDFMRFTKTADLAEAFRCFDSFRILCAVRKGVWGVEQINGQMMALLKIKPYQHGYPVMITANDYGNQLFNGDIGLCFKQEASDEVRVYFPGVGGQEARSLGVAQLPAHEPVFAMTIHKAQGSGFDRVLVILPSQDNPVLTKELLYTGLTRTKKHCTLWGTEAVIRSCVSRSTQRMSGLAERLG